MMLLFVSQGADAFLAWTVSDDEEPQQQQTTTLAVRQPEMAQNAEGAKAAAQASESSSMTWAEFNAAQKKKQWLG